VTGLLIDTNVVSELRKGQRAARTVRAWFERERATEMWLSVLTVGELRRGVALIERRDPDGGAAIGAWLDSVVADYEDRILPITERIAERWALITVPDPLPVVDALLAATALEHDLVLATRNTEDVERSGVRFVNPFLTSDE
jgi:predicted nucleic acid-binding protein